MGDGACKYCSPKGGVHEDGCPFGVGRTTWVCVPDGLGGIVVNAALARAVWVDALRALNAAARVNYWEQAHLFRHEDID